MEDLRENRPFESLVGFLVNSGRRFFFFFLAFSISLFSMSLYYANKFLIF